MYCIFYNPTENDFNTQFITEGQLKHLDKYGHVVIDWPASTKIKKTNLFKVHKSYSGDEAQTLAKIFKTHIHPFKPIAHLSQFQIPFNELMEQYPEYFI